MKRLLKAIRHDPLLPFRWLRVAVSVAVLRLRGVRCAVYNLRFDYFYDIFKSVHSRWSQDPRVRVYFAIPPGDRALGDYLRARVGRRFILRDTVSPFVPFRVFLTADVTGPAFPLSGLRTRTVQIYHGTGVYNLYPKKALLTRFDAHLAVGPQFREFLEWAYRDGARRPHIYDVGYPKTDALFQAQERTAALRREYGLEGGPVLLYAPHWNPDGSLHALGEAAVAALARPGRRVLVKPHHYLYAEFPAARWRERLKALERDLPGVTLVDHPDTQELYPLSDLMVSDTGTTAPLEFSLLLKPILVFEEPRWFEGRDHAEVERGILDAAFRFRTAAELSALADRLTSGRPDALAEIEAARLRQAEIVRRFFYNPGRAVEPAVAALAEEMRA